MSKKIYLITLLSFCVASSFADDTYDNLMRTRGDSFASLNVSNDLIDELSSNNNLRVELGANTNVNVQRVWQDNARSYMSTANNRAYMTTGGAGQSRYIDNSAELLSLDNQIKEAEELKNANARAVTKKFRGNYSGVLEDVIPPYPSVGDPDFDVMSQRYNKVKKMFDANGLGPLFDDIDSYNSSSLKKPSHLKAIMGDLAFKKNIIQELPSPKLKILSEASVLTLEERTKVMENGKAEVAKLEAQKKSLSTKKQNPIQTTIDDDFFKKKNLNIATNMADLTESERILLLNHPDKRLRQDSTGALKIINEQRADQKKFILNIKELSNDVVESGKSGKPIKTSIAKQAAAEKLGKKEATRNSPARYKDAVRVRMNDLKRQGIPDAWSLQNPDSRLAYLDILNEGSINPYNKREIQGAIKGKSAKQLNEMLKKIPDTDLKAKKLFVKYILESNDANQIRNLRPYASQIINSIEADNRFSARCGK